MSDDSQSDPFAPPEMSTEVCCIHCGETYDSWQIEWRVLADSTGKERGFWCCPMPGCDGMGFGFDILPTDPHYQDEHGGWVYDDDSEEEDDDEEVEWEEVEDGDAWNEAGEFATGKEFDEKIPWDEPDQPPPSDQENDFPFSAN